MNLGLQTTGEVIQMDTEVIHYDDGYFGKTSVPTIKVKY